MSFSISDVTFNDLLSYLSFDVEFEDSPPTKNLIDSPSQTIIVQPIVIEHIVYDKCAHNYILLLLFVIIPITFIATLCRRKKQYPKVIVNAEPLKLENIKV